MATELMINASLPETRIALMENGEIQELLIERASGKGIVGNIYKGRVMRVLPGMQAAFVDIGLEKAAFLYVDDVYVHSNSLEKEDASSLEDEPIRDVKLTAETDSSQLDVEFEMAEDSQLNDSSPYEDETDSVFESSASDEGEPVSMGVAPDEPDASHEVPEGTLSPVVSKKSSKKIDKKSVESVQPSVEPVELEAEPSVKAKVQRRHTRPRRGTRFREATPVAAPENAPMEALQEPAGVASEESPSVVPVEKKVAPVAAVVVERSERTDFKFYRARDRRVRTRQPARPAKNVVNIQDLLKEGQEVLVQVAKDPIATKGARLTCHISIPGRHLVCMPTINHVGVSRRIERDDERRRLRECVERYRPKDLGFIVRTASGRQQPEKRIKQDIDYLTRLWSEIQEKAAVASAPVLVYEDLNAVLRSIRDWVTEEIDKVIVDSHDYYEELQRFVSHFMPSLKQKIDLYQGDIPIFDAYGISTELSRALERKVWLKSGGYIVIDQTEALVAIDVNTGRYVGKRSLEDTILKTNLEAVQEIAYQLRLRNCGGIIILDLIDMEKEENKHRVYRALEDALSRDRARPTIMKISDLGLIEMTRKRTRDTIIRTLCESCNHCEGKGFVKSKQTVAYEVMREIEREGIERDIFKVLVQAHSDVIDILAIDEKEALDYLERRYRKQIHLQSMPDYHPEQFEVTGDRLSSKNRQREASQERTEFYKKMDFAEGARSTSPVVSQGVSVASLLPSIALSNISSSVLESQGVELSSEKVSTIPNSLRLENIQENSAAKIAAIVAPVEDSEHDTSQGSDAGFEEEDRLAFLRAQAAQDAALARLNPNSVPSSTMRTHQAGMNRADRSGGMTSHGRRNLRNNRRNPARHERTDGFKRNHDRSRMRNGAHKPFGYAQSTHQKWNDQDRMATTNTDLEQSASSRGEDPASSGSSGGTFGNGDRYQKNF